MNIKSIFFLLSSLFIFANCSTISLTIPGATIESPEVAGKGKRELGPSAEPAREIEYSDSVNARPPDLENAREGGATHTILHQARFGLGEKFELGGEMGIDDSSSGDIQYAFMIVSKFQLFGANKKSAKRGDFSGGLFARLGYVSADGSGDQSSTFGPGGFPWDATVRAYYSMLGISFGYRVADPLLVYLSGSYQNILSKIEVNQSPANDNSDPGGSFSRDRNGNSTAAGLGMQFRLGKIFYFHGKLMMFHFSIDGIEDENTFFGGGGFHFYF